MRRRGGLYMMVLVRALELGRNGGSDVAFSLTFVLGSLLKPFTVILTKLMRDSYRKTKVCFRNGRLSIESCVFHSWRV
jgi:hypothetical protein